MHGLSQFLIARNLPPAGPKHREVMDVFPFFSALQNFIKIDEIEFGPDPPDFVMSHGGRKIGVELTKLNPKPISKSGFTQGEFCEMGSRHKSRSEAPA